LEWAAIHDRFSTFKRMLMEEHIDIILPDSYDVTLLHRLAGQGKTKFVAALIKKHLDIKVDPFQADSACLTPLHYAAGRGMVESVNVLIAFGADVSAKDRHGNMPLHSAAVTGSVAVFRPLIRAGADVNAQTRFDWTAIDQASIAHHYNAVDQLLLLGA
ncbi:ankyrin, partial [Zopfia rhizophila CBS 207.26]